MQSFSKIGEHFWNPTIHHPPPSTIRPSQQDRFAILLAGLRGTPEVTRAGQLTAALTKFEKFSKKIISPWNPWQIGQTSWIKRLRDFEPKFQIFRTKSDFFSIGKNDVTIFPNTNKFISPNYHLRKFWVRSENLFFRPPSTTTTTSTTSIRPTSIRP